MISIIFIFAIAMIAIYTAMFIGLWKGILGEDTNLRRGFSRLLGFASAIFIAVIVFSDILPGFLTFILAFGPFGVLALVSVFN